MNQTAFIFAFCILLIAIPATCSNDCTLCVDTVICAHELVELALNLTKAINRNDQQQNHDWAELALNLTNEINRNNQQCQQVSFSTIFAAVLSATIGGLFGLLAACIGRRP